MKMSIANVNSALIGAYQYANKTQKSNATGKISFTDTVKLTAESSSADRTELEAFGIRDAARMRGGIKHLLPTIVLDAYRPEVKRTAKCTHCSFFPPPRRPREYVVLLRCRLSR